MRRSSLSLLLACVVILAAGLLVYGLLQGDHLLVLDNAAAFCFT